MFEYKENQYGTGYDILKDGERVGSLIPQGDKVGYTIFGTPHMGTKDSMEEAKAHIQEILD